jgi:hypothetical protein
MRPKQFVGDCHTYSTSGHINLLADPAGLNRSSRFEVFGNVQSGIEIDYGSYM